MTQHRRASHGLVLFGMAALAVLALFVTDSAPIRIAALLMLYACASDVPGAFRG